MSRQPFLPLLPGLNPKAHWLMNVHPVYWVPALLTGALVLLIPSDVLVRFPLLHDLTTQIGRWFPFLLRHAAAGTLGDIITLTKCLSFITLPALVVLPFLFLWSDRGTCLIARLENGRPPIPWWMEAVGLGLLLLMFVSNWVVTDDPSTCRGCTTSSRIGLAFVHTGAALAFLILPIQICTTIYVRLGLAFGVKPNGRE